MKIGTPVETFTSLTTYNGMTKYKAVYDAVDAADGLWVPVECDNYIDAKNLRVSAVAKKRYEAKRRRLTVYIAKKRATANAAITLKAAS